MSTWQRFAGTDPVQESISFDNRMAAADELADWIAAGCPSADEFYADDLLADDPEPVEDPSRYATADEYYGGLLAESCGPLLADDGLLPESAVLDRTRAVELRALIRRDAA